MASQAVDYLLGELSEMDRVRCDRRMVEDPAFAAEVERVRPLLGPLVGMSTAAWGHVADSHGLVQPRAVAGARLPVAMRPRWRLGWRWPVSGRIAVGSLAAAVAVVAVALALVGGSSQRAVDKVQLSALAGVPATAHATATILGAGRVQVAVDHLPPTDPRHYYELWLMTDTTHLVAVASFRVNGAGDANLSLPLPASPSLYRYLNISLQSAGAGTSISNQSLLRGPIARA
jgi:anti-sigma-K factor RskA